MTDTGDLSRQAWADALHAAALFAVAPSGLGGVVLRAHAGPVRDLWLTRLRDLLPEAASMRRIPLHVTDGRLLGGLDLPATLQAGRPVAERGILAESDQGIVILAMAERLSAALAARLAAVIDSGEVVMARDGVALRSPARLGVVALDESALEDEAPPPALLDRLALHLDLRDIRPADALIPPPYQPGQVAAARALLPAVTSGSALIEAMCATALALGIASMRAPLLALQVARAAAALAGRDEVVEQDVVLAARLVYSSRATALPASEPPSDDAPGEPEEQDPADSIGGADQPLETQTDTSQPEQDKTDSNAQAEYDQALTDSVLAAAAANIPGGLLARIKQAGGELGRTRSAGRAGAMQNDARRGRPAGIRRGEPRAGARLNVIATLRAAAPWQRLRQPIGQAPPATIRKQARIQVRREDFHVTRFKQRAETTTIFAVDASGSAALHRLAEAKGAVELLLADCYARRDRVGVIAFRGRGAEVLLPPTRSLVRAKRSLAGLPGGGGTPLAAGIDAAVSLGQAVQRSGGTPLLVLLTDGRANVSRAGTGGRAQAGEEAVSAARAVRLAGLGALLVDTSPQPQASAQRLAAEMHATYLPLPHAGAADLSAAVQGAAALR